MTDELTFIEELSMFGGVVAGVIAYGALIAVTLLVIAFVFGEW